MDNNYYNSENNNSQNNNNNGNVNPYSASNSDYGFPQQQYNSMNYTQNKQSNKAKMSMICGILGVILCFVGCFCCLGYVGIPLSIVAIVFANQSKSENGGVLSGEAKVGMITGIAGLVLLVLGFLAGFVIGFVGAMNGYTIN